MNKKKYNYLVKSSPADVCIELERHPEWNVISITTRTIPSLSFAAPYPKLKQETEYIIFYYTYE